MIPKSSDSQFLMMAAAEQRIDAEIVESRRSGRSMVHVELLPIKEIDVYALRERYRDGGWTVKVDALRTPNGYAFVLS